MTSSYLWPGARLLPLCQRVLLQLVRALRFGVRRDAMRKSVCLAEICDHAEGLAKIRLERGGEELHWTIVKSRISVASVSCPWPLEAGRGARLMGIPTCGCSVGECAPGTKW
jgi:hypothetical protein